MKSREFLDALLDIVIEDDLCQNAKFISCDKIFIIDKNGCKRIKNYEEICKECWIEQLKEKINK